MKRKHYSEEQIISILKEHCAGLSAEDVIRKHGIAHSALTKCPIATWYPVRERAKFSDYQRNLKLWCQFLARIEMLQDR